MPTLSPSAFPTNNPSNDPTNSPTYYPTKYPTSYPTYMPSSVPTPTPTSDPTNYPTELPTYTPTLSPSASPTDSPTIDPTNSPTFHPTKYPTPYPTYMPSSDPTTTPTSEPTNYPTKLPTYMPTLSPSAFPTNNPTNDPTTSPTYYPTKYPTSYPTYMPSSDPTSDPTNYPTELPTYMPTLSPSALPTDNPTVDPTNSPTFYPTKYPTPYPTDLPTSSPTEFPTHMPTLSSSALPTNNPTTDPTNSPTLYPTKYPTSYPTYLPSSDPTSEPTNYPTKLPTYIPTLSPSAFPTNNPTIDPTRSPTFDWSQCYGESCYHKAQSPTSWTEADNFCEDLGAELASVHSTEENTFLYYLCGSEDYCWLGFSDAVVEGVWNWSDGSNVEYTNWDDGEPNDHGDEDYASLSGPYGRWNDRVDGRANTYAICEKNTTVPFVYPSPCYGNSCYYKTPSQMTWDEANTTCLGLGAELASIHSLEENTYLYILCGPENSCWHGFNDAAVEDEWEWSDGSNVEFTNWENGEPDDNWDEDYALIVGETSQWNDMGGSYDAYSICQKSDTIPAIVWSECYGNWCYYKTPSEMSWPEANMTCVGLGVELASVHSIEENMFLFNFCGYDSDCWIGLTDEQAEGYWEWTDGSNFDYENWGSGQPNNYWGQNYVIFDPSKNGQWNDKGDSHQAHAICMKAASAPVTLRPTSVPTYLPSSDPTPAPIGEPTNHPTKLPTDIPTKSPSALPTSTPTVRPTNPPSLYPTKYPTLYPTYLPSSDPTPTPTSDPSNSPTKLPTYIPTFSPSDLPTKNPTMDPTYSPTFDPTKYPTMYPTYIPSSDPTPTPTREPTNYPTKSPTHMPTLLPSSFPTNNPTSDPTNSPTLYPTNWPTLDCGLIEEWTKARADGLCPEQVHHAYGVGLCDKYDHPDYQRRLEFALANQLYLSCEHICLYDYDTYNTSKPHAFKWTGKCYNVATGWYCIDQTYAMEQSHIHAATLCETTKECVERNEWTQEVSESICPDGYSNGDKGWGTAKVCPNLIRLDNGFYEKADVLYEASFNRSLASRMFLSCSAKCLYDVENEGVVYQWKGDCWVMQTDWACITVHVSEYEWAMKYLSENICAITTPAPVIATCVEREQDWTDEIADQICPADAMGVTKKGVDAIVCTGYEDYQYRLDHSLANRAFLTCDSWCVYDVYKIGYEAFIWNNAATCYKPVSSGLCIWTVSHHREQMTDYIENILCEATTPEPTEAPTCIAQQEWSEELMDNHCTVDETRLTHKHHGSIGRAAVPCSGSEDRASDLLKSLAMRMYNDCSSWCVFDYASSALLAWKWSNKDLCWNLQSWGSCHWDYSNQINQTDWNDAKLAITLMCTYPPTQSPTDCVPRYTWDKDRAEELCPSLEDITPVKSFGVTVCDDDSSLTKQASLEKSLANNFFNKCSSWCVYDYDTIMNNIINESADYGGFIWKSTCWKWVTGWACFTTSLSEFEAVSDRALDQCEARN